MSVCKGGACPIVGWDTVQCVVPGVARDYSKASGLTGSEMATTGQLLN
jgi:hypothetical protein